MGAWLLCTSPSPEIAGSRSRAQNTDPGARLRPVATERFLREARVFRAKLHHPNIVAIFDVGVHAGGLHVDRVQALRHRRPATRRRATIPRSRCCIIRDIAKALDYAHRSGRGSTATSSRRTSCCATTAPAAVRLRDRARGGGATGLTREGTTRRHAALHESGTAARRGRRRPRRPVQPGRGAVPSCSPATCPTAAPTAGRSACSTSARRSRTCRDTLRTLAVVPRRAAGEGSRPTACKSGAEVGATASMNCRDWEPSRQRRRRRAVSTAVPAARRPRGMLLDGWPPAAALAVLAAGAWGPVRAWQAELPARVAGCDQAAAPVAAATHVERSIAVLPLVKPEWRSRRTSTFPTAWRRRTLDMLAQRAGPEGHRAHVLVRFQGKVRGRARDRQGPRCDTPAGRQRAAGRRQRLRITVQLIRDRATAPTCGRKTLSTGKLADVFDDPGRGGHRNRRGVANWRCRRRSRFDAMLQQAAPTTSRPISEYLRGTALLPMRRVPDLRAAVCALRARDRAGPADYARGPCRRAPARLPPARPGTGRPVSPSKSGAACRRHTGQCAGAGPATSARPTVGRASRCWNAHSDSRGDRAGLQALGLALAPSYTTGYLWYSAVARHELCRPTGRCSAAIATGDRDGSSSTQSRWSCATSIWVMLVLSPWAGIEEAKAIASKLTVAHPDFRHRRLRLASGLPCTSIARRFCIGELRAPDRMIGAGCSISNETAKMLRCLGMIDTNAGLFEKARSCPRQFGEAEGPLNAIATARCNRCLTAQGDWTRIDRRPWHGCDSRRCATFARLGSRLGHVELAQARPEAVTGDPSPARRPEWFKRHRSRKPNLDNEYANVI